MIDRRLLGAVPRVGRWVALSVAAQWADLVANVALVLAASGVLGALASGAGAGAVRAAVLRVLLAAGVAAVVRLASSVVRSRAAYRSSRAVKRELRTRIYRKLLRLGPGYREVAPSSEVVQMATEGVEQLETYFASYLPQLAYAVLAPVTLFAVIAPMSLPPAVALLACVPLIPLAIAAVQTWAKRLLGRYWGQYAELGDTFLENLQGLVTLKAYQVDGMCQERMAREAEGFRRATMRVLTMQLNSIAVMDLVAFGGAAAGIALTVMELSRGALSADAALAIVLLSADYFVPMRQLGSCFHVAMNGMAASERVFRLLDAPEPPAGTRDFDATAPIVARGLRFSYDAEKGAGAGAEKGAAVEKGAGAGAEKGTAVAAENAIVTDAARPRPALDGVDLRIEPRSLVAVVGRSGCGKSTLASLLMGRLRGYEGSLEVGGAQARDLSEAQVMANVTYVGHRSYVFAGTLRQNLLMAAPGADDARLWDALRTTRLDGFVRAEGGLDMRLEEGGQNLSGGQRQRLAIARALLHDTPVYVLDEATSNIDAESEEAIMAAVRSLRGSKTVVLVTHRLANTREADSVLVMDAGRVVESGTHDELMARGPEGRYARMYRTQMDLETMGGAEDGCN